jgi:ketosteroid isomerase-like protein
MKMKADQRTTAEVTQTFKAMFEAYKKKDLQATLSYWAPDPDLVAIGTGADEKAVGLTQFTESLKRDWAQGELQSIGVTDFSVSAAGLVAWFSADITLHGTSTDGNFDFQTRLTGVMEKRNGKWLWVQMHLSTPSCEQEHGHSWPTNP